MVFTKLSVQEKDAFFGLLDEYFQSRPELLGKGGGSQGVSAGGLAGTGISTATAASVVQRAFAANATSSSGGAKSNNPYASAISATSNSNVSVADVVHAVPVGRVAAASLAFSQAPSTSASASPSPASSFLDGLPSLPRRGTSSSANVSGPGNTTDQPGSEVDKLVTRKTGVFNAFKKPPQTSVAIPSAFGAPKNAFAPPPVRRMMSDTNKSAAPPRAPPRREPEEEAAAEGEWVEALYDYTSEDPGDLGINAGMRVWVTARSSEDWWTGQVEGQGREGLFPASYVKPL